MRQKNLICKYNSRQHCLPHCSGDRLIIFLSANNFFPQCVPILGRGFETGGYKCECKQGFEYPFEDLITYYDGQLVEAEFLNIATNNKSRWDKIMILFKFLNFLKKFLFLKFLTMFAKNYCRAYTERYFQIRLVQVPIGRCGFHSIKLDPHTLGTGVLLSILRT